MTCKSIKESKLDSWNFFNNATSQRYQIFQIHRLHPTFFVYHCDLILPAILSSYFWFHFHGDKLFTERKVNKQKSILCCCHEDISCKLKFLPLSCRENIGWSREKWKQKRDALMYESRLCDDVLLVVKGTFRVNPPLSVYDNGWWFGYPEVRKRLLAFIMKYHEWRKSLWTQFESFYSGDVWKIALVFWLLCLPVTSETKSRRKSAISRDNFIYVGIFARADAWKCLTSEKQ